MADILNDIDEALARNTARFDPFGGDAWDDNRVDRWGDGMRVRPARAGIEEEAEPAEAVAAERPGTTDTEFLRLLAAANRAREEIDGSAPICRGCRRSVPWLVDGRLCRTCWDAFPCANERTNALNSRRMTCIRPAGHPPPCEEGHPDGSQWVESPVEALRPERQVGNDTVDLAGCNDRLDDFLGKVLYCAEEPDHAGPHRRGSTRWTDGASARPAPPVDELVEPAPVVDIRPDPLLHAHVDGDPYQCSPDCPMPPAPRPWWKRWLR